MAGLLRRLLRKEDPIVPEIARVDGVNLPRPAEPGSDALLLRGLLLLLVALLGRHDDR